MQGAETRGEGLNTTELVSPERAIEALRWAARVAHDPDEAADAPARPTPAEWRALSLDVFREHFDALIVGRHPEPGLDAASDVGLLDVWMPEVAGMVGFGDGEWRHKDVWKHTKQVVKQSVPRLAVRWGALLHDIGKPRTRKIDERGRVSFHGHAELGARMFRRKLQNRLGFDNDVGERIHFLILHHLRPSQYDVDWTDAAVRRFYTQMGDGLKDLLDLSRADITTKRPEKRKRGVKNISDLGKRIDALHAEDTKPRPLPKGLGQAVMERFGVPPSKRLGDLMKDLEAAAEAGEVVGQEDFEVYLAFLAAHAERFGLG